MNSISLSLLNEEEISFISGASGDGPAIIGAGAAGMTAGVAAMEGVEIGAWAGAWAGPIGAVIGGAAGGALGLTVGYIGHRLAND